MTTVIYGIKNCDTMKKARQWLDEHGQPHVFHDYKLSGVDRGLIESWVRDAGWETILNRAGTTFRKLPDETKAKVDAAAAIELMLEQPSMVKRPVLVSNGRMLVGFKPEQYQRFFEG